MIIFQSLKGVFKKRWEHYANKLIISHTLPQKIRDQGIRRYGFHGLSYEWIVYSLRQNEPKLADSRMIASCLQVALEKILTLIPIRG
jgi:acetate kinase